MSQWLSGGASRPEASYGMHCGARPELGPRAQRAAVRECEGTSGQRWPCQCQDERVDQLSNMVESFASASASALPWQQGAFPRRPKPANCLPTERCGCSGSVIFGNTRLSSRTHCDSPVQARSTGEVLKAEPWTASPRRAVDRRAENAHLLREPRLFARDEHVSTGGGQEHTDPWDKSLPQERVALGRGSGRTGV